MQAADGYPPYDGDSIGFRDGDKLVIHTNQVSDGITITGRPMKNGEPAALWSYAVAADGRKYDPREGFRVR